MFDPTQLGFVAIFTAQTEYIQARVCASLVQTNSSTGAPHNATDCNHRDVLSAASNWNTYIAVTQTAPSLVLVGSLGGLSEAHGRAAVLRLVMVVQMLGAGVVAAVSVFDWPLWVLLVASSLQGLSGYYPALLMAVFSTAADLSTAEERTVRVARVEGSIFLGLTAGSAASGAVASVYSFGVVFIASTVVYGVGLLMLLLLVPESLPPVRAAPYRV